METTENKTEQYTKKMLCMGIMLIFAMLSFNSMAKNINNIALASLSLHGIGTQQPISGGKGNRICGIYKITSPAKKVYIGQSKDIIQRWRKYKRNQAKGQTRLFYSFKKYGIEKHRFEIIHRCSPVELNDLEVYYIDLFQSFNSEFGMNLTSGGGVPKMSDETKEKLRKNMLNNSFCKGKKWTIEHKTNFSNARKNVKLSSIHVQGLKKAWVKRRLKNKAISCEKIVLDVQTGVFYNSIRDASNILAVNYKTLWEHIKKNKTSLKIV